MARFRLSISMSLDGFVAGPNQSVEHPLGIGGEQLHAWAFPLVAFRRLHGQEGGETNESNQVLEEMFENVGATVMGRNMFGGHPGPWSQEHPWNGWWGTHPPFRHPVFVVTHFPRRPLELEAGNHFIFVTGGIESALELARTAAGGKDVHLGGGASIANQYLTAGLVDELNVTIVPIFLGRGERLFQDIGSSMHGLQLVRTIATPKVTHLRLAR